MGIEISGKSLKNFAAFLNMEFDDIVFVLNMFSNDNIPPITGRRPMGSGELKSLNQRIPSVKIAGFIVKSYESLFINETLVMWIGN
jgi:hypothetical protein